MPSCQVLDSTPGWLSDIKAGFFFLWEMAPTSGIPRLIVRALILLVYPAIAALFVLVNVLTLQWLQRCSRENRWRQQWVDGAAAAGIRHHLLMCSADDNLIAIDSVCEFAAALLRRDPSGSRVQVKDWQPSTHVQHYRQYPDAYAEVLKAFLQSDPS